MVWCVVKCLVNVFGLPRVFLIFIVAQDVAIVQFAFGPLLFCGVYLFVGTTRMNEDSLQPYSSLHDSILRDPGPLPNTCSCGRHTRRSRT